MLLGYWEWAGALRYPPNCHQPVQNPLFRRGNASLSTAWFIMVLGYRHAVQWLYTDHMVAHS